VVERISPVGTPGAGTATFPVTILLPAEGAEGFHPEMLMRLLLYGYAIGLTSSRRIEKATYDLVPFRYLAACQHPDHDTIASFRQQHLEALAALFVQALKLCVRAGLVKLHNVAIDGTKLKANAGWGRGRSHAKMSEGSHGEGSLPPLFIHSLGHLREYRKLRVVRMSENV